MTRKKSLSCSVLGMSVLALPGAGATAAGFIEDSKANLELRNFYLNRDFRENAGQNKREEWAQGFILNLESGFTQGTVGFGVDAIGMLGIKLDSSPDRSGTDLLPRDSRNRAEDDYSKLGVTGKVRFAESQLRVGTLLPKMPYLQYSNARLLPQVFEGFQLQSKDLEGATFTLGEINRVVQRNVSGSDKLALNNKNGRFGASPESDELRFAGVDYAINPQLLASYHYAELSDIYRQHFAGLQHTLPLGAGKLKSDLRYFNNSEAGQERVGKIDNQAINAMFTYSVAGHSLGLAYQKMRGDDAFTYVNGATPYLTNFLQINDFAGPDERSWQLRYDFDFATVGVPGLTFMTRYVRGDQVDLAAGEGREWERNTDIAYGFTNGPLKNLKVTWRNATYRSSFVRDLDENRLILSYIVPLW
ncbi:outer membrane OprD family porin [Ectopseudomonas oleovorans]|uniref:Outer membrane OprD family porin n=2 Tax=Pseudomonadaceae TaxID=135621 RepID=A0A397NMH8_ECTOL|nr:MULTISPECIES: OprD family porin [Pseudomonas]QMV65924.1 OprD family porin [Pseudomonas berkeleyensis]RIA35925.1 outer membrane OprD family porin [Pseudomonas oleovorans]WSO41414.1 OprD family porin [Pseudomonas berkeleyensis]